MASAVRARRARTPSDAPDRIRVAALEAFSQKGFEGARTRDIASRAGVPLGLVQYHFGTKDALWKAAVASAFADLERGLDGLLESAAHLDERELLRSVIRAHVRFVAENTAFIRIMHDEGKQRGPRMRWLTDRYVGPLFAKVTPLVAAAQARGVLISDVDPGHLVYALVGAAGMIFHQAEECRRVSEIDPADPDAVEAHSRVVESLFLGAPPA